MKKVRILIISTIAIGFWAYNCHAADEKCPPQALEYSDDVPIINDSAIPLLFRRHARELIETGQIYDSESLKDGLKNRSHKITLPKLTDAEKNIESIYKDCGQSVFIIGRFAHCSSKTCKELHYMGMSSGFFITETGIAVTNYHVMEKARGAMVIMTRDKKVFPISRVLAGNPDNDIAIIQIYAPDEKFRPLTIAPHAPVGSDVYVIHHPAHNYFTLTTGKLSRYYKKYYPEKEVKKGKSARLIPVTAMAITADFSKGSSGAPILDKYGRAIGVVRSTLPIYHDSKTKESIQMVLKHCVTAEDIMKLIE